MGKHYNSTLEGLLNNEYQQFMTLAERVRWSPATIPYEKIDYTKLTMADLFGVFVTLHIENYSDVYTKLLLKYFADAPMLCEFIKNWEREEENHARVLERYMMQVGFPLEELRSNYALVDKNDFPFPTGDQAGLNVFVYFQELLTREMYTKMLKACKEPVLADILKRVVRDEERHYRFYKQVLTLRLQLDKGDTLTQFRKIVRKFGMPQTMFRQQAMTDRLMEFFPYGFDEIMKIADPILKFLEASPSPWLERFPRAQALWQKRRALAYMPQSPYLWGHVSIAVRNRLGLTSVPEKDKQHVQSVIDRLHGLHQERLAEVAVHDRFAARGLRIGDRPVAELANTV